MLSGLFLIKKSFHVGIHVNSEDYGISHICYPYTPILILLLPPTIQPYPTSRAQIVDYSGTKKLLYMWNPRERKQRGNAYLRCITTDQVYPLYIFVFFLHRIPHVKQFLSSTISILSQWWNLDQNFLREIIIGMMGVSFLA